MTNPTAREQRRAQRLDRKTKPIRDAIMQWVHENGTGGYCGYNFTSHEWELGSSCNPPIEVRVSEDGTSIRVLDQGRVLTATTGRGVRRVLDNIFRRRARTAKDGGMP